MSNHIVDKDSVLSEMPFVNKDVIKKYRLISSPNIQSVKKSLQKKDLIDIDGQAVAINDSLFKLWLKRQKFYE